MRRLAKFFDRFKLSDDGAGLLLQYCLYELFTTRTIASCYEQRKHLDVNHQNNTTYTEQIH